ncbi:ankyrin repeat-containing domain protein [Mycena polygramma]|nr:ankyrin repeat-containing domain protein [Mycena polygramma]
MAEVLGTVASILQFVDLALKAVEVGNNFVKAPAEREKLRAEMGYLKSLLEDLQAQMLKDPSSSLLKRTSEPLVQFRETLEEFTRKLQPQGAKFRERLTWAAWSKKDAEGYLNEFERFKALLNLWLTKETWEAGVEQKKSNSEQQETQRHILAALNDNTQREQERSDAAEQKRILDWISPSNFFQRQADIFSTWQPGTGEWLLADSQFTDWENSCGEVLWCRGMPGAGKTVLVSMVVNYLRDKFRNSTGTACIYLNHKEADTQTPTNVFASLCKQLLLGRFIPQQIRELYKQHSNEGTRPSMDAIVKALQTVVSQYTKVYLVVDALDECPEVQRNVLLQCLALATEGSSVNLMITSRPHITLDSFFPHPRLIEIHATEGDIHLYLDTQIKNSPRLSRHVQTRPELRAEVHSKILANVQGMFLQAKLHIESLTTKNTIKALCTALQNLPQDLTATYDEERVDRQNEDDKQLAHQVLTWVTNAMRPMSVAELRDALAVEPDTSFLDGDNLLDIDIVLSVCAGLIIVDGESPVVRVIHYTAQHYFDSIQAARFPDAHADIASSCFTYLSFAQFSTSPSYWNFEAASRLLGEYPLLSYSQYCLLHAAKIDRLDLNSGLQSFAHQATSWKNLWETLSHHYQELAAPWTYRDWPSSPSLLWIAAASNLITVARHLQPHGVLITDDNSPLRVASYFGHFEMVQLLLEMGFNPNYTIPYETELQAALEQGHESALQAASEQGHESVVRALIDAGADLEAPGGGDDRRHNGGALHRAAVRGHQSVVRLLVEAGANVDAIGGIYGTPLQAAASSNCEPVVRLLIDAGAKVNTQGGFRPAALVIAAGLGNMPIVELLIKAGAEVDRALQAAARKGDEPVVRLLIQAGADVNATGEGGTALQAAAYMGHELVAQMLIEAGADVNAETRPSETSPLHGAARQGHLRIVRLLVDTGADINTETGPGGPALREAAYAGHADIVKLLIDAGADVNPAGGINATPLRDAAAAGHALVVQLLFDAGADVNATKGTSYWAQGTALQTAAEYGHEAVVRLLIGMGADINATSQRYGTAVQAASNRGHLSVVRCLIDEGADVNARAGSYGTALQAASYMGRKSIIQLLIKAGANPNAEGGIRGTALQAASGEKEIVQLLVEAGAASG